VQNLVEFLLDLDLVVRPFNWGRYFLCPWGCDGIPIRLSRYFEPLGGDQSVLLFKWGGVHGR